MRSWRHDAHWRRVSAGIYRVEQGQPVEDLCPDGSYVIPYQEIQKSTYNKQVRCLAQCVGGGRYSVLLSGCDAR